MLGFQTPVTEKQNQTWWCKYLQCNHKLKRWVARASQLQLTDSSFDYVFRVVSKVSTVQQKALTMLWYAKFESIFWVHREFRCEYGVRPPDDKSIRRRYKQLRETDSMEKSHSAERPRRSDEDVTESEQVDFLCKRRVTYSTKNCPWNSLEEPMSKTTQITGSPETNSKW
jgi:hypothetical protein